MDIKHVPASRIQQTVGVFRRVVQFEPGFDDRGGDYGLASMKIRFALVGDLGAVHFLLNTGWVPGVKRLDSHYPCGSHIGYHWKTNPYEHDGAINDDECDWLPGGCFYDASYRSAEPVAVRFVAEGADAVWADLEQHYQDFAAEAVTR